MWYYSLLLKIIGISTSKFSDVVVLVVIKNIKWNFN